MEVCHEVKVEVMRYLDEVAAQLHYLSSAERELILQQLYARISHALEHVHNGQPTVRDLHQVLAGLPSPAPSPDRIQNRWSKRCPAHSAEHAQPWSGPRSCRSR